MRRGEFPSQGAPLRAGGPSRLDRGRALVRHHRIRVPLYGTVTLLAGWVVFGSVALSAEVAATQINGATQTGTWVGVRQDGGPVVELQIEGAAVSGSLDSWMSIEFPRHAGKSPSGLEIRLADGGVLWGEIVGATEDAVDISSALGESLRIKLEAIAGVRFADAEGFPRAAELYASALHDRLAGQDTMVTRSGTDPKALRGRVVAMLGADAAAGDDGDGDDGSAQDGRRGRFLVGGRERTFAWDKMFGVVFAAGAGKPPASACTMRLVDGSEVGGAIVTADAERLTLKASIGVEVSLPLSLVQRISVRSERVVFLSDLTPVEEQAEGLLSRPWPMQRDRSVSGGTISMQGRAFPRGIGVRAKTSLTYELNGAFECFAATIGIDDAVRPRGNVVFRVLGDGATVFDSGAVSGRDGSRDVTTTVAGVRRLTLEVDFGEALDLSDHADWGAARVLRVGDGGCGTP